MPALCDDSVLTRSISLSQQTSHKHLRYPNSRFQLGHRASARAYCGLPQHLRPRLQLRTVLLRILDHAPRRIDAPPLFDTRASWLPLSAAPVIVTRRQRSTGFHSCLV